MTQKSETAWEYFCRVARDGRAALVYHEAPLADGTAEPRLWLCVVGGSIVACDDVGPDGDDGHDSGYVTAIKHDMPVVEIIGAWRNHTLMGRRRGRPRKAA